jgi:hypothetical protein
VGAGGYHLIGVFDFGVIVGQCRGPVLSPYLQRVIAKIAVGTVMIVGTNGLLMNLHSLIPN